MPKVDGVIYVVRFNLVKKRNALSCIARMREAGVPIVGAVLNSMINRLAAFYTNTYDASFSKYYTETEAEKAEKGGKAGKDSSATASGSAKD